jgi:hypothetical protein
MKYYTITETSQMEVPINITIPWAAKQQAKTRVENRGHYDRLVKTCSAAKELNSIIEKHTDRYFDLIRSFF